MTEKDIASLLKDREHHAEKVREIDAKLRKVRDEIDKQIGGNSPNPPNVIPVPYPYPVPAYPRPRWFDDRMWLAGNTTDIVISASADA